MVKPSFHSPKLDTNILNQIVRWRGNSKLGSLSVNPRQLLIISASTRFQFVMIASRDYVVYEYL